MITGEQFFFPEFGHPDLDSVGPEIVTLAKLLCTFGPPPDALIKHVNDEKAGTLLKDLWDDITELGWHDPFEKWSEETNPENFPDLNEARPLISRMTNLDPAKRAVMSDIMIDPYWRGSHSINRITN